jgi:hypothetical protein
MINKEELDQVSFFENKPLEKSPDKPLEKVE